MHFTIDIDKAETPQDIHWIPPHVLGNGWTRQIVELAEGDTADNPSSTKGPIYGPNFVVYDVSPNGITTRLFEDAGEFYRSLMGVAR